MNKIKKETFQKLITLFKFKREDYDVWNEMLNYLDEDAIDEAIITWIQTKTKTPTVADIVELAKEIEIKNRVSKKQNQKTQEEKTEARAKLYEEAVKALKKNYYLVFRKIASGDTAYSWMHETCVNNTKNLKSFNIKNPYTEESVVAFFENN